MFTPKTGRALVGTTLVGEGLQANKSDVLHNEAKRLVDRYIREVPLVENTLCMKQHAYQEGKSAETALAAAVTEIEKLNKMQLCSHCSARHRGRLPPHLCGKHLPGCKGG